MIIMSVDYGDARTGVAFCDAKEVLASPYCMVNEKYKPKLVDKLAVIAADKKAEKSSSDFLLIWTAHMVSVVTSAVNSAIC